MPWSVDTLGLRMVVDRLGNSGSLDQVSVTSTMTMTGMTGAGDSLNIGEPRFQSKQFLDFNQLSNLYLAAGL